MARNPFAVAASQMRPSASIYQGAAFDRLNADWVMSRLSADMALRWDLPTLRNRARELVINNSHAAAVPQIFSENVIGKDGIGLQAQIQSTRGNPNDTINNRIEESWQRWAEPGNCTADGKGGLADALRLICETECTDGEVLIHLIRGYDNPWGFAIDILDPDQLDVYYNVTPAPGRNAIKMGVEQDQWGRAVAYHLWSQYPTDPGKRERQRIPASEIIHLYIQRRPKQSRGVTWFAPVVFDLKMLGGYREAELVAARAAAAKMGFLKRNENAEVQALPPGETRQTWDAEAGVIETLPVGFEFQAWDPQHPTAAFDAFDKANLRSTATALRIAYMSLSGDLNGTSYGSGRIGMLAERAVYQAMQQRIVRLVLTPVYRAWLRMSLLTGALDLGSFDATRFERVSWHPRAFPWIDPGKDMDVALRGVAAGIDSLTRICEEQGRDFRDVIRQRAAEIDFAREMGVPLILEAGKAQPLQADLVKEADQTGADDANETDPPNPDTAARRAAVRLIGGGH